MLAVKIRLTAYVKRPKNVHAKAEAFFYIFPLFIIYIPAVASPPATTYFQ